MQHAQTLKHRASSSISAKSDKRKDSESAAPASSARESDESPKGRNRARSEVPSDKNILDVNINHLMSSIAIQTNKLKENLQNLQNVRQESRLMSASQSLISSHNMMLDKLLHRSATPNENSL
jgi:hypothetical protein